jgi:hypothetical protein
MAMHPDLNAFTDEATMPHLLGDLHVEKEYPAMMPLDDGPQDQDMWGEDSLLGRGMAEAKAVMEQAAREGRLRGQPRRR